MSTHFRPRPQPPPTPTSPVRPSTAHSTIRAVTPSPPETGHETFKPNFPLPRSKSERALGSTEMATYARYVLQAENGGFGRSPVAAGEGVGLRRGGAKSGRSSPVKARSKSPSKRPFSTTPGLSAYAEVPAQDVAIKEQRDQEPIMKKQEHTTNQEQQDLSTEPGFIHEEHHNSDSDTSAPDTPTPMTRAQKRQAYTPLRLHTANTQLATHNNDDLSFLPPGPPVLTPTPAPKLSPSYAVPRKAMNSLPPANRISVSGASHATFQSTASKNSVFSTLGRDELERKKAMIEIDEGPFARVQSMMDLDEERRRISGAIEVPVEKEDKRRGGLGCGCAVM